MAGFDWQIIILLILAILVFSRLLKEFGKRDGFEPKTKLKEVTQKDAAPVRPEATDVDLADELQAAVQQAQNIEPDFRVNKFLIGAKSAYEMILMAYLNGDMESVRPFVDPAVYEGFEQVVNDRIEQGQRIEAEFLGVQDVKLVSAQFDQASGELELGVEFLAQLRREVLDSDGNVLEGDKAKTETQKDVWFFERKVGTDNPNWILVATDA